MNYQHGPQTNWPLINCPLCQVSFSRHTSTDCYIALILERHGLCINADVHGLIAVSLELRLKILYNIIAYLEGLGQKICRNKRFHSKDRVSNGHESCILAPQGREIHRISLNNIKLEMNKTSWKNENVTLLQDLGEAAVVQLVWRDKSHVKFTLHNHQDLSSTRVNKGEDSGCMRKVERVTDMPRVLSLRNWSMKARGTFDMRGLEVFPGYWKPWKKEAICCSKLCILAELSVNKDSTNEGGENFIHVMI